MYAPSSPIPIAAARTGGEGGNGVCSRAVSPRSNLTARQMLHMRLHTRTILRDGQQGFIGSQSLRRIELDARREVGITFRDARIVSRLATLFEDDWALTERTAEQAARE